MTSWWHRVFDVSTAWKATAWYTVLTLVMTWPLAPNIARDIPGDLGDPLFVCWAIGRALEHWTALLSGDLDAAVRFWHAGIFYPERYTTAYSEHFAAHALMVLPAWLATRNIILCYNLLFLSTFVLSGTGMYLLARELTGSTRGAFVAGLLFMFTPYRFATMAHLQVISSQWMPFALYGLRRYFSTGSKAALAGAMGAIVLQNLSSGYYLIYFGPFIAAYALVELWTRHRRGDPNTTWRTWRDLVIAGAAALAGTLPFVMPYLILQRATGYRRHFDEIAGYGADLFGWLTASTASNVWSWLRGFDRAEGILFPGLTLVVLGLAGVTVAWRSRGSSDRDARAMTTLAMVAVLFAMWMAMGPVPTVAGKPLAIPAIYRFFYTYVPGFDVSRVTSRFATMVVLFLAMAAAYGTAWLDRTGRRRLLALVAVGALLDGASLPLTRNLVFQTTHDLWAPEDRVYPEAKAPVLWRHLKTLPPDAVIAHIPFGHPEHEIRYMFYSLVDGHRLSNGYSGAFPASYLTRMEALQRILVDPVRAVERLRADGVTYAVVHLALYRRREGEEIIIALEGAGMRTVARVGTDVILATR